MDFLRKLFKKAKSETQKEGTVFKRYVDKGICDVCNREVGPGEAYLVPIDVFYASKQYREWLAQSPVGQIAIPMVGSVDAYIAHMRSMDQTPYSAVCPKCIYMFQ